VEQLSDLSQSARRFYSLVCEHAEKVWQAATECAGGSLRLDMQKFSSLPQFVKVELIRRSLTAIGSGEKDLTQQHYEKILQLSQQNKSCRRIELPGGFVVWREYGSLIFAQSKEEKQLEHRTEKSVELKVPGQTKFVDYIIESTVFDAEGFDIDKFSREKSELIEWFDFDKVKQPLVVRSRKVGDRFRPLGLLGEKRIGKFLTAARIEHKLRKKVVIIADKNKIIWVGPIRASELTKIKASTKRILQIRLRQL
jgi:tRNA(Ile)-lysidine synthase